MGTPSRAASGLDALLDARLTYLEGPPMPIRLFTAIFSLFLSITLAGCGAVQTVVKKRDLDVQTQRSETIFLEPVSADRQILYLSVRNTSDQDLDRLRPELESRLGQAGYRISNDPATAQFMLQVNVLQVAKSDLRSAELILDAGFGGAVGGVLTAAALGGGGRELAAVGLLGAAAELIGDALVDDTVYRMVTDIQIRERPGAGEVVSESLQVEAAQGSSATYSQQVSGGTGTWKTYRTRIVSTANQANLDFDDAKPALQEGLVRSLAGLFAE